MFTLQTSFKSLLHPLVEVIGNSKEESSVKTFVPITSKNSASVKRVCVADLKIQKKFFFVLSVCFLFSGHTTLPTDVQTMRLSKWDIHPDCQLAHTCIPAFELHQSAVTCSASIYIPAFELHLSVVTCSASIYLPAFELHQSAVTCSASIYVYLLLSFIYRLSRARHLSTYCKACKLSWL
jgi:hypothetical protein